MLSKCVVKEKFVVVELYWKFSLQDNYFEIRDTISKCFDKPVYFLCSTDNCCTGDLESITSWILDHNLDFNWEDIMLPISV